MELLVVIVILMLLIAILLPALITAKKQAEVVATRTQMRAILNGCARYKADMNAWPGVVSDREIAADPTLQTELTSNENLLLSLMGAVVEASAASDPWSPSSVPPSMAGRVVDLSLIGSGPRTRSGHRFGAYVGANDLELAKVTGTLGTDNALPELVDRWRGLPLLVVRAQSPTTPTSIAADAGTGAYFLRNTVRDYTEALMLKSGRGEVSNQRSHSLLSVAVGVPAAADNLAWITADPRMSDVTPGVGGSANNGNDVHRGELGLIAAGDDEIYFARDQLDEHPSEDTIDSFEDLAGFDDIVEFTQ